MTIKQYIDIDRIGCGYILTVKESYNKKGELVETIQHVKHLDFMDLWSFTMEYEEYEIWPRCEESGDLDRFLNNQ